MTVWTQRVIDAERLQRNLSFLNFKFAQRIATFINIIAIISINVRTFTLLLSPFFFFYRKIAYPSRQFSCNSQHSFFLTSFNITITTVNVFYFSYFVFRAWVHINRLFLSLTHFSFPSLQSGIYHSFLMVYYANYSNPWYITWTLFVFIKKALSIKSKCALISIKK